MIEKYEALKKVIQEANPEKFNPLNLLLNHEISIKAISLSDVLLAIENKHRNIHIAGNGVLCLNTGQDIYWNLRDDNLDHQSEETKTFLIDLLVK